MYSDAARTSKENRVFCATTIFIALAAHPTIDVSALVRRANRLAEDGELVVVPKKGDIFSPAL
jgi:hypothetical protein